MISVMLRYGALLAVFLVAVETAKRSYLTNLTNLELYLGLVAVAFLILGFLVARRSSPTHEQDNGENTEKLSILDRQDFSERELDVLLFLCHGYSNSEIADQLGVTTNTVKTHLKNIYGKLGVNNRTQAAAEAKMVGIVG